MTRRVARLLFRGARTPAAGRAVGWGFAHLSSLLPLGRLYETERLVAFYHPKPAYPLHILIVPKQAVPNLRALSPNAAPLLAEIVAAAQQVVERLRLEEHGYRLIINGGRYQDVGQLHVHLVSGR